MAQKLPRNQALHERRHKRKAGTHWKPGREAPKAPGERRCRCTFNQRMVGDGCYFCNPTYMQEEN